MVQDRATVIEKIKQNPAVSVLVIGGGINGIGTYRDLALQGVDVLLVDKVDYCAGASAASSHMLHGGIRYLENGEFRLVREALLERNLLLQNAPHYAKPLPTTIPIYKWFSGILNAPLKFLKLMNKPGERGALVIKMGLILYDWYTRNHRMTPTHDFDMRAESLKNYPDMDPNILCTATYYDGWIPYPERLCVELLEDAQAENENAHSLNYMAVTGGKGDEVLLRDEVTGEELAVKPKLVINAAGPWIDFVNRSMEIQKRFIGGTKGSHLVLDHPELHAATGGHEIFFENNDGRIVLIFPFLGRVIIGTTDIRVDDPENIVCSDDEIKYMFDMIPKVFPNIKVDKSHIVFHFSGVRPLPYTDASYTGNISRDHITQVTEPNNDIKFPVLSLVGGKWTTYRAFSEHVTDDVLKRLGLSRKASTRDLGIGGGKAYPRDEASQQQWIKRVAEETGLNQERVRQLFDRYGTRADRIAAFCAEAPDKPLENQSDYSQREILFLMENEAIVHVDDLLLRRSLLAMCGYVNDALLAEITDVMATAAGWPDARKQEELSRTAKRLKEQHGMTLTIPTEPVTSPTS